MGTRKEGGTGRARRVAPERQKWTKETLIAFLSFVIGTPVAIVACYAALAVIPPQDRPLWANWFVAWVGPLPSKSVEAPTVPRKEDSVHSPTPIGSTGVPQKAPEVSVTGGGAKANYPRTEIENELEIDRGKYAAANESCKAMNECLVNACSLPPESKNSGALRKINEGLDDVQDSLKFTSPDKVRQRLHSLEDETEKVKERCQQLPSCCIR